MIFATQRRTGKHRHFRRMHDKKVNVLALAAVLGAPDAVLPREVAAGLPQLMAGLLRLLVALKQQQVSSHGTNHGQFASHSHDAWLFRLLATLLLMATAGALSLGKLYVCHSAGWLWGRRG